MTFYFLDTSALVKRYHVEAGSSKVAMILAEPDSSHLISRLGLVEAVSAFALKVREGRIQVNDFSAYRKRLLADVRNRTINVARVRVAHFKQADQLLQRHGMSVKIANTGLTSTRYGFGPASTRHVGSLRLCGRESLQDRGSRRAVGAQS